MNCGQSQIVTVSVSQLDRERLSGGDIPRDLVGRTDCVIELYDIANMEAFWRWLKYKEDVGIASRLAVRQRHVESLYGRTHDGLTLELSCLQEPQVSVPLIAECSAPAGQLE